MSTFAEVATPSTGGTLVLRDFAWSTSLGLFCGVGAKTSGLDRFITSSDGTTWTLQNAPEANTYRSVTWSPSLGLFVAVASSGTHRVATSTDGVNWSPQTAASASGWQSVVWADSLNLFVAVGSTNVVMTSPNGVAWTSQTGALSSKNWVGLGWSHSLGLLVAVASDLGTASIMTSTDGSTWNQQTHATIAAPGFSGGPACGNSLVAWSSTLGLFAIVGRTNSPSASNRQVFTSSDGVTWAAQTMPASYNSGNIVWCGNQFVSNEETNSVVASTDGSTWVRTTIADTRTWDAAGYSPTLDVLVTSDQSAHDVILRGSGFAVPVDAILPTSGHLGGTYSLSLTSAGSNGGFLSGCRVLIDNLSSLGTITEGSSMLSIAGSVFNEATNIVISDTGHLTCTAPIGLSDLSSSRVKDVLVINSNTSIPNVACYLPGGFTYLNPTVTTVTAATGPAAGGTAVTLTGTNFYAQGNGSTAQNIYFGSNPATSVVVVSSTSITCVTPASTSATNPVDVSFRGIVYSPIRFANGAYTFLSDAATTATLPTSFTYTPSWFSLSTIPAELLEDAQLNFNACVLTWSAYFGAALAAYLCAKFGGLDFNLLNDLSIHWYSYGLYRLGTGWTGTTEPAKYGWFQSVDGYTGACTLIIGDAPHDPRSFTEVASFATGAAGMLGGFPGVGTSFRNHFIYASGGYTVGTTAPDLRLFDGLSDRAIISLPLTAAGVMPKAVMSLLLQGETIYLSTLDSGTTSADFAGRVFSFDPLSGTLTQLGADFTAGEVPYALCWHMGRLWCGTNKSSGAGGKVYYLRPGIDTTWTADYTLATSTAGGVCSLASFQGKLYVGTDNSAGNFAKVLVRDSLGAYTTSKTASGGTAKVNNSFLYLLEFNSNLYATYWNPDTTAITTIYKFDGSSWSSVYSGASGTLRPLIGMFVSSNVLYAMGGGNQLTAILLSSSNGSSWTDLSANLVGADATAVPVFGEVII